MGGRGVGAEGPGQQKWELDQVGAGMKMDRQTGDEATGDEAACTRPRDHGRGSGS